MVILYYEKHSFRIIDVSGCNDMFTDVAERICFAEHWKLVAESSEFHMTQSRSRRAHFFQFEIRTEKRDISSQKRESEMVLKKLEFTPESGNGDTYANTHISFSPHTCQNHLILLIIKLASPFNPKRWCSGLSSIKT